MCRSPFQGDLFSKSGQSLEDSAFGLFCSINYGKNLNDLKFKMRNHNCTVSSLEETALLLSPKERWDPVPLSKVAGKVGGIHISHRLSNLLN